MRKETSLAASIVQATAERKGRIMSIIGRRIRRDRDKFLVRCSRGLALLLAAGERSQFGLARRVLAP
jgi:hypothetical protein